MLEIIPEVIDVTFVEIDSGRPPSVSHESARCAFSTFASIKALVLCKSFPDVM